MVVKCSHSDNCKNHQIFVFLVWIMCMSAYIGILEVISCPEVSITLLSLMERILKVPYTVLVQFQKNIEYN